MRLLANRKGMGEEERRLTVTRFLIELSLAGIFAVVIVEAILKAVR
jgi:hypothetical protein